MFLKRKKRVYCQPDLERKRSEIEDAEDPERNCVETGVSPKSVFSPCCDFMFIFCPSGSERSGGFIVFVFVVFVWVWKYKEQRERKEKKKTLKKFCLKLGWNLGPEFVQSFDWRRKNKDFYILNVEESMMVQKKDGTYFRPVRNSKQRYLRLGLATWCLYTLFFFIFLYKNQVIFAEYSDVFNSLAKMRLNCS